MTDNWLDPANKILSTDRSVSRAVRHAFFRFF